MINGTESLIEVERRWGNEEGMKKKTKKQNVKKTHINIKEKKKGIIIIIILVWWFILSEFLSSIVHVPRFVSLFVRGHNWVACYLCVPAFTFIMKKKEGKQKKLIINY